MGKGMLSPIARLLRLFRAGPRAAHQARVGLECLEERCVMAGLAGAEAPAWYTLTNEDWVVEEPGDTWQYAPADEPVTLDHAPRADPPAAPADMPGGDVSAPDEPFVAEVAPSQPTGLDSPAPTTTANPASPTPPQAHSPVESAWRVSVRLDDAGGPPAFLITRTAGPDARAQVSYTITAFTGANAVRREGVVTITAGASHANIPADPAPANATVRPEIVTLTLQGQPTEPVGPPALTIFLSEPQACSEAALFEAYRQAKSPEAFDALVDRHRPNVLRACHKILGSWHDAEDVSQLVFLALAQQHLRLQTTLAGWLNTVARNASIALLRSRRRRQRHEQGAAKPATARGEEAGYDLREELDTALSQVAAPLRDAVRLRYLEGWSQQEAAGILGCPRGTLSQRAALGLRYLRGILGFEAG